MNAAGLTSVYALTCLSVMASILVAGLTIAPAYKYFEKKNDTETARRRSLLVALGIWVLLQIFLCFMMFISNEQLLM